MKMQSNYVTKEASERLDITTTVQVKFSERAEKEWPLEYICAFVGYRIANRRFSLEITRKHDGLNNVSEWREYIVYSWQLPTNIVMLTSG